MMIYDEQEWAVLLVRSVNERNFSFFETYFHDDWICRLTPSTSTLAQIGDVVIDNYHIGLLSHVLSVINEPWLYQKMFDRAGYAGHVDAMKMLLMNAKNTIDVTNNRSNALRWACINGHLSVVEFLMCSDELDRHADISCFNYFGYQMASANEHVDIIDFLLSERHTQHIPVQETSYDVAYWLKNSNVSIIHIVMRYIKRTNVLSYMEYIGQYKQWCEKNHCMEYYENICSYEVKVSTMEEMMLDV